jgi:hypothetical protein
MRWSLPVAVVTSYLDLAGFSRWSSTAASSIPHARIAIAAVTLL